MKNEWLNTTYRGGLVGRNLDLLHHLHINGRTLDDMTMDDLSDLLDAAREEGERFARWATPDRVNGPNSPKNGSD